MELSILIYDKESESDSVLVKRKHDILRREKRHCEDPFILSLPFSKAPVKVYFKITEN